MRGCRAGERPFPGLRLVQALNVGAVAGLSAAVAVYFLANRLLLIDLAGRAEWEIRAFFGAWIIAALVPLARLHCRAWCEGLWTVTLFCLAVVAADVLILPKHTLRRMVGDPLFAWFDAVILTLAFLFAFAARRVARYEAPQLWRRQPLKAGSAEAGSAMGAPATRIGS